MDSLNPQSSNLSDQNQDQDQKIGMDSLDPRSSTPSGPGFRPGLEDPVDNFTSQLHGQFFYLLNLRWSQWAGHPLYRYVLSFFPQVSSNKTPQDIYRTKNGLDMELDGIYLLCKF